MSAPTQTKSYGKRTCMHCHKEFEAFKPSTVTCSPKCHKARRRELDRALKQKRLKPDNLDWLNNEYEELKADRMEVSDILLASAFMDFADAKEEMEWLNCRFEAALGEIKSIRKILAVAASESAQVKISDLQEELASVKDKLAFANSQIAKMESRASEAASKAESQQAHSTKGKKYRHICCACGSTFKSENLEDKYCCEQCFREHSVGLVDM